MKPICCALRTSLLLIFAFSASLTGQELSDAELVVPANTAYLDFQSDRLSNRRRSSARVTQRGVENWGYSDVGIVWYGQFNRTGNLIAKIRLASPTIGLFELRVGDQVRKANVLENTKEIDFGNFRIDSPSYWTIQLRRTETGEPAVIESLAISGDAVRECHFNLKPRRNAASVHLMYPVPAKEGVAAFYCELTALEDPVWSYYMACGWHRGYFGMQVNSPTERRIIFSVWDSGNEAIDRDKVSLVDRVTLVSKGESVYSGDFGNEGTGGHSHLKYLWKTGEKQRFVVTAEAIDETHTIFAGYYFHPDSQQWMLISSWKAPKEGGLLRGLYSFSENFVGSNGNILRRGLYGNQWIQTAQGDWMELTTAKFSHDATGREDRRDRFMSVEQGQFMLSHGGFVDGYTEYGEQFTRPATNAPPKIDIIAK